MGFQNLNYFFFSSRFFEIFILNLVLSPFTSFLFIMNGQKCSFTIQNPIKIIIFFLEKWVVDFVKLSSFLFHFSFFVMGQCYLISIL